MMNKVYVVHVDVDYEGGYVSSVHSTRKLAENALSLLSGEDEHGYYKFSVKEYEIDE
jgi:hypothetical protein